MKRITSLVAVLAAAMALVAAFSAASASADTVLCSAYGETPCPLNEIEPAGSYLVTGNVENYLSFHIEASGQTEFECNHNTMIAESKQTIGNPLPSAFYGTLSGCRNTGNANLACTGSMNQPKTTLEAAAYEGTMKIGSSTEPLAFTFECGVGSPGAYTCVYKATDTFNLNIEESGVNALAVPLVRSSGSHCFNGSPRVWVRNELYGNHISKYTPTGTVICKTTEEPCAEGNRYGSGTALSAALKAGTKSAFSNPVAKSECSSSSMAGQLTGSGGVGQKVPFELTSASFTGCNNSAIVSIEGLPWHGTIASGKATGEGSLVISDAKLKWSRLGITCYYGGQVSSQISNNAEFAFNTTGLKVLPGSSGFCGTALSWSATYGIGAPNPFYVTWI